jgi:hypothetical protein
MDAITLCVTQASAHKLGGPFLLDKYRVRVYLESVKSGKALSLSPITAIMYTLGRVCSGYRSFETTDQTIQ